MIREFYHEHDGLRLHCILERPREGRLPLVILQHGLTGHMEERHILGIRDALLAADCAVLRTELYGHGLSSGEFRDHTIWKWVDELLGILRYARTLDFVDGLYLSGHSQGGLTALLAGGIAADIVDGLLLLAPAVVIRDNCRDRGEHFGVRFDPHHIPDELIAGGRVYDGNYFRTAARLPVEDCVDAFTGPVLIVHGDADELVPYAYSTDLLARYRNARLVTLPDDDHCFDAQLELAQSACADFMRAQRQPKA